VPNSAEGNGEAAAAIGQDGGALPRLNLRDPRLFQGANFDALRTLLISIKHATSQYVIITTSLQAQPAADEYSEVLANATLRTNCQVELAFHQFWTQFVLKALPAHIQLYADYHTISCDMQSVIAQLLTCNSASLGQSHGQAAQPVGSPYWTTEASSEGVGEQAECMEFEDFLSYFNDHTSHAGRSLAHAFYADFLAGLSPVFLDLLKRHGQLLEQGLF
jgi:hypothetical protein